MSLYDFFRRAFLPPNNPGQPGFRNPIWEEESDDDEDDLDELFGYAPNSPFGFRIFSGDVMDMHKYFEQQMDEMLKNFHSSFFGSELLQLPDNSFREPSNDPQKEFGPNKYLKPWFDKSIPESDLKQDTDIDGRVNAGDLRNFFRNEEEEVGSPSTAQVPRKVFGQSVITRIVRTPDGRVEEEKRVRGIDGREEVSLTRQIGDQKYKVITKKDTQNGVTDTTEELINLDQDKLDDFNRHWDESKSIKKLPLPSPSQDNSRDKIITIYPPTTDGGSSFTKLFEKWFK